MTVMDSSIEATVVLIEDEDEVLRATAQTLELAGFTVFATEKPEEALERIDRDWNGVVLTDVRMPRLDGFAVLHTLLARDPELAVVMISGHGDIAMAVRAVHEGAYDFLEKPIDPEHLPDIVRRALDHRALVLENRRLRAALAGDDGIDLRILGRSKAIDRLRTRLAAIAATNTDVLVLGDTGTGKELVARCLHDFSSRRSQNFVAINCGALPESLIESELFGHEPGAFTGARSRRIGKIEHANGGTLFLDEIESMSPTVQVKLLRVLQERIVERVGSNQQILLDLRVVAATKVDLRRLAEEGNFREDLYYRLAVATLRVPPLRERREDIPLLFRAFAERAAARLDRALRPLPAGMVARLQEHDWPGNVRELRNAAERWALALDEDPDVETPSAESSLRTRVATFERAAIEEALAAHGGRVGQTATALGITRKTLYLKMREYSLGGSRLTSVRAPTIGRTARRPS
jgi:two-component system C4-dicarboxylate transport response regulator DctD